jgi:hypothetical protein
MDGWMKNFIQVKEVGTPLPPIERERERGTTMLSLVLSLII